MKKRPHDTPLDRETYEQLIKPKQLHLKEWCKGKGVRTIAEKVKGLPIEFGRMANGVSAAFKFTTHLDINGEHEYVVLDPWIVRLLEERGLHKFVWQLMREHRSQNDYIRIKTRYPDGGKNSPTPCAARIIYELAHNVIVPRGYHVSVRNGNSFDLRIANLEMRPKNRKGLGKKK